MWRIYSLTSGKWDIFVRCLAAECMHVATRNGPYAWVVDTLGDKAWRRRTCAS